MKLEALKAKAQGLSMAFEAFQGVRARVHGVRRLRRVKGLAMFRVLGLGGVVGLGLRSA